MRKKDISFLVELHERLNEPEIEVSFTPNMSGGPIRSKTRYSRDSEKLNDEEMKNILEIVQEDSEARFYPINSHFGFYPFYVVGNREETLLRFSDKQLPREYNFKILSKHFNNKDTGVPIKGINSYYYWINFYNLTYHNL